VADADILLALEAATFAPSPLNCQPWNFIIIRDERLKDQMARAIEKKLNAALGRIGDDDDLNILLGYTRFFAFFEKAPVAIAVVYRTVASPLVGFLERAGVPAGELEDTTHSEIQGTAAAIQNMLLKLHELGLGASWMTNPLIAAAELESLLEINKPWHLAAIIPVGVPASLPPAPRRKPVHSIAKFRLG
jgi:nitroreductase